MFQMFYQIWSLFVVQVCCDEYFAVTGYFLLLELKAVGIVCLLEQLYCKKVVCYIDLRIRSSEAKRLV